jgi:hypothetical protein
MSRGRQYSKELMDRGVRLVMESGRPISEVARDLVFIPRRCASGCVGRRRTLASGAAC